ncbi:MAG: DUF1415 domain-containing protein, partial [Pseudomonadota bacterium]
MLKINTIVSQTKCWLDNFIIAHNICPFAKRERDKSSIRFYVDENTEVSKVLENLMLECERLDQQADIETTLFIVGKICHDFNDYLDFVDIANQLLNSLNYQGVYQLATFHPHYCFAESTDDDPANYTNRSPYPMLHIIREQSLEKALNSYPNPELIPERNIKYCQKMGLE